MRDQSSLRGIISYRERKRVSLCYCFWLDLTTEFIRDACYMQMDGAKLRAFNRDPTGLTTYRIRHWNHFLVILERIIVGLYPRSWIHAIISGFFSTRTFLSSSFKYEKVNWMLDMHNYVHVFKTGISGAS